MRKLLEFVSNVMEQLGEKSFLLSELMFLVGGIGLVALAPFYLAKVVLLWSQSKLPVVLHTIVLLEFFFILGLWAWEINGDRGKELYRSLYKRGIKWPFLVSIALLLFAIPCFTSLTTTLNDYHLVKFDPAIPTKEAQDFDKGFSHLQDFYSWHFLDSIPGMKVPETLAWNKPYKYCDHLSGVLLLAFKVIVIIPVIGSFTVWHRVKKEATEEAKG